MTKTIFNKLCNDYAYLYLIKLTSDTEEFYKIGITSKETITPRFVSIPYEVDIVALYKHKDSSFIMDLESKLISISERHRPEQDFAGQSECVTDITVALEYLDSLNWIKGLTDHVLEEAKSARKKLKAVVGTNNFKKICMQYEQALITGEQEIIDDIETDIDYKDLVDFVEIFSINKLSSVSYQKSKIITELNKYNMFKNNVTKLKRELKLVRNQFYTAADLKQRFQDAYTYLQIPGKPVAATVKTIYNAKATKKNNEKGYLIGSELS